MCDVTRAIIIDSVLLLYRHKYFNFYLAPITACQIQILLILLVKGVFLKGLNIKLQNGIYIIEIVKITNTAA